jgi:hypothetical protein
MMDADTELTLPLQQGVGLITPFFYDKVAKIGYSIQWSIVKC